MADTIARKARFVKAIADGTTAPEALDEMEKALAKIAENGAGGDLPEVTAADNGKALLVANGAWGKAAIPSQLPEVSASDNGKALLVAEGVWGAGSLPAELPTVTAADNGKVLGVVNGAWAVMSLPE